MARKKYNKTPIWKKCELETCNEWGWRYRDSQPDHYFCCPEHGKQYLEQQKTSPGPTEEVIAK